MHFIAESIMLKKVNTECIVVYSLHCFQLRVLLKVHIAPASCWSVQWLPCSHIKPHFATPQSSGIYFGREKFQLFFNYLEVEEF
jgi:hypothetical protein